MPESALDAIRDAIVTAVRDGVLPAERLADAALRAATLGRRPSSPSAHSPASLGGSAAAGAFDPGPSASAAERAIQVAGAAAAVDPPDTGAPLRGATQHRRRRDPVGTAPGAARRPAADRDRAARRRSTAGDGSPGGRIGDHRDPRPASAPVDGWPAGRRPDAAARRRPGRDGDQRRRHRRCAGPGQLRRRRRQRRRGGPTVGRGRLPGDGDRDGYAAPVGPTRPDRYTRLAHPACLTRLTRLARLAGRAAEVSDRQRQPADRRFAPTAAERSTIRSSSPCCWSTAR